MFLISHSAVPKGVASLKQSLFLILKRDLNYSFSINIKQNDEQRFVGCKFITKTRCLKAHTEIFLIFKFRKLNILIQSTLAY